MPKKTDRVSAARSSAAFDARSVAWRRAELAALRRSGASRIEVRSCMTISSPGLRALDPNRISPSIARFRGRSAWRKSAREMPISSNCPCSALLFSSATRTARSAVSSPSSRLLTVSLTATPPCRSSGDQGTAMPVRCRTSSGMERISPAEAPPIDPTRRGMLSIVHLGPQIMDGPPAARASCRTSGTSRRWYR